MVGPRVALLAKESVAPSRRSSAGCMLESIGRLSIGVRRRHPVTNEQSTVMQDTVYNASLSAATQDWSAVDRDRAAVQSVLAAATRSELASCFSSVTR